MNGNYVNEMSVSIGGSVIFQCTCLNSAVQWKLNGENITTNNHYIINATSGTLTIPAVQSSNNGIYTCISNSFSLTVTSKYMLHTINILL